MYYTSTEEARSDLFLSAAWFLIGPFILGSILDLLRINRIGLLQPVLAVALPLVYTVLVPALLIRYRRDPLSAYGTRGGVYAFGLGVVLAIPLVLAAAVVTLLSGGSASGIPGNLGLATSPLDVVVRLAQWVGMAGLAVYVTVKARDAFSGYSLQLREGVYQVGRILGLVAVVATALLVLGTFARTVPANLALFLLQPVAVAVTVLLALRTVRGPSVTTRATLVAPTVVLGLAFVRLTFQGQAFVGGLWLGALFAGIGLVIATLMEGRRSALAPIGLAITIAVLTFL